MIGLYRADVLAQMMGNSDMSGVTNDESYHVPNMEITVNGVQAKIHRVTLTMATLAALLSNFT